MKWWDQMPWSSFSECWALNQLFHSPLSLSSRDFLVPSSLSAIRVVSSAYLRLLIFLPKILIPACASSSPAFLMMYSACKLNKQGDSIQPWHTPFLIWNQSVVPCPVLTHADLLILLFDCYFELFLFLFLFFFLCHWEYRCTTSASITFISPIAA